MSPVFYILQNLPHVQNSAHTLMKAAIFPEEKNNHVHLFTSLNIEKSK